MVSAPARAPLPADQFRKIGSNRRHVHRPLTCLRRDLLSLLASPVASRSYRALPDNDPESALRRLTACSTASAHHAWPGRVIAHHAEFAHASTSCRTGLESRFSRQKNFWPETRLALPRSQQSRPYRNKDLGTQRPL